VALGLPQVFRKGERDQGHDNHDDDALLAFRQLENVAHPPPLKLRS
jgi:hypothetical protein